MPRAADAAAGSNCAVSMYHGSPVLRSPCGTVASSAHSAVHGSPGHGAAVGHGSRGTGTPPARTHRPGCGSIALPVERLRGNHGSRSCTAEMGKGGGERMEKSVVSYLISTVKDALFLFPSLQPTAHYYTVSYLNL